MFPDILLAGAEAEAGADADYLVMVFLVLPPLSRRCLTRDDNVSMRIFSRVYFEAASSHV